MNAQKRGKSWRCRVYDKLSGKQMSFTADTKRGAELLAAQWLADRTERPADMTVYDAISAYIGSKDNTLSPSTVRGYRIAQRNAYEAIKNKKIGQLTAADLQNWANTNAAKYSAKSIKNQIGLLSAVLKQQKIKIDLDGVLLKSKTKTPYNVPSESELSAIIAALRGKKCEIPVLIAIMCGCRQSEILALRWGDYDGEALNIHAAIVPNERGQLVRKEQPKSYAGNRTLQVSDTLRRVLDAADHDREYISPYRTPSGALKAFQALCAELGLPRYKMHELRHAYASIMLLRGVPDKYAMELLGQSTPNMIKNVYQHTFDAEHKKAAAKINSVFDELAAAE